MDLLYVMWTIQNCLLCFIDSKERQKSMIFLTSTWAVVPRKRFLQLGFLTKPSDLKNQKIAKSFLWAINTDILCLWKGYQISRIGPKEEMSSGVSSLVYKQPVIKCIIEQSTSIGLLANSSYGTMKHLASPVNQGWSALGMSP